jgi:putative transposase
MALPKDLLDELLKHCDKPEDLFSHDGLISELTGRLVERMLEGEMNHHLGYDKHSSAGRNSGNSRNGHSRKQLRTKQGQLEIAVPRDRNAQFEPKVVKKRESRIPSFDEKVISLYARGMTLREIKAHLEELYHTDVSTTLISNVTEAVMADVIAWQNRPLESLYPIIYLDAIRVKIRSDGHIENKACYLALGVNLEGRKELLGLWIARTEGAKFWLNILTELKNRGLGDVLICCVDGLTGFAEAIAAVYPATEVQLCIVHLVRNSLRFVPWKDKKAIARDLKTIYQAPTLSAAEQALSQFGQQWDGSYASISKQWHSHWSEITPMFAYPADIRRAIYTTNAIESVNRSVRKIIKTRGSFPSDEAAMKLLYLALERASKKWTMPIPNWAEAMNRFLILFPDRIPI